MNHDLFPRFAPRLLPVLLALGLLAACSSSGGGGDDEWHRRFGNTLVPQTAPLQQRLDALHAGTMVEGFSDRELKDGLLPRYFGRQPGIPIETPELDSYGQHNAYNELNTGYQEAWQNPVGRLTPRNTGQAYNAVLQNGELHIGHHLNPLEDIDSVTTTSPISPHNLTGSQVWNKNGLVASQGETVKIINHMGNQAERHPSYRNVYDIWAGVFDKSAYDYYRIDHNNIYLLMQNESGVHDNVDGKVRWQVDIRGKGYDDVSRTLTEYDKTHNNIYLNRAGEWARQISVSQDTPVSAADAGSRTDVVDAAGKPVAKDAQGRYLLAKGEYALIQQTNGRLRIEPWNEANFTYFSGKNGDHAGYSVFAGIENAAGEGAFADKRVIANLFSATQHETDLEHRALHSYDIGRAGGYNQAYLSLYTWQLKDTEGNYPAAGAPYNIGVFNRVPNNKFTYQQRYGVEGEKLDVSYHGVAYSSRDGKQDGVLDMSAHFKNQVAPGERESLRHDAGKTYGAIDYTDFSYEGKITGRRHDGGRDIYFASGNVRTSDGSMPEHRGQSIGLLSATEMGKITGNDKTTVWMQGDTAKGEDKVVYGSGRLTFAGPHAEEVGGMINITTHEGPNNIGFIGKRQ